MVDVVVEGFVEVVVREELEVVVELLVVLVGVLVVLVREVETGAEVLCAVPGSPDPQEPMVRDAATRTAAVRPRIHRVRSAVARIPIASSVLTLRTPNAAGWLTAREDERGDLAHRGVTQVEVWGVRAPSEPHSPRMVSGYRRDTVTPPENAESCSSICAGEVPSGMSNTSVPLTLLPGLISSSQRSLPSR